MRRGDDCPESSTCPRRGQYGMKVCAGCAGPIEFEPMPGPQYSVAPSGVWGHPVPVPVPKLVHGLDGVGLDREQVLEEMWKQLLFVTPPDFEMVRITAQPALRKMWGE